MFKGFKDFILRGNVVDLAVGVIIGAAFGKIVSSFVNDILMPPLGLLLGGVDFSNQFFVLKGGTYPSLAAAKADTHAVVISYGVFLNNVVDFLIVAAAVYFVVMQLSRMLIKPPAPSVTTKNCPFCATAIPLAASRCPHCTSQLA